MTEKNYPPRVWIRRADIPALEKRLLEISVPAYAATVDDSECWVHWSQHQALLREASVPIAGIGTQEGIGTSAGEEELSAERNPDSEAWAPLSEVLELRAQLSAQVDVLHCGNCAALGAEAAQLKAEVTGLQESFAATLTDKARLCAENDGLVKRLNRSTNERFKLITERDELREERDRLIAAITAVNEEVAQLREKAQSARLDEVAATGLAVQARKECDQLRKEVGRLEKELTKSLDRAEEAARLACDAEEERDRLRKAMEKAIKYGKQHVMTWEPFLQTEIALANVVFEIENQALSTERGGTEGETK